jgi:hypothetical protein
VSPDDVYQVGIELRSRALGEGFLVDPAFVVTSAAAVRDAGPAVELRVPSANGAAASGTGQGPGAGPGAGAGETVPAERIPAEVVPAEVVEVLGDDGLALLEVAAPGFAVLPPPAGPEAALDRPGAPPIPARALAGRLLHFQRLGARRLRADLDGRATGGRATAGPPAAEHLRPVPAGAGSNGTGPGPATLGGGLRNDPGGSANGRGPADHDQAALLLAYLRERARSGLLDPMLTVPALDAGEGSR